MSMKKFFKWLLLLIVLLAVAIAVFLFNPGLFKGPLERAVSNASGYSISLEGELEIDTGRLLGITATNIRVAAPDWAARRDLASAGYLRISLETASLLADSVVVDSLQISELKINLETNNDGSGNWSASGVSPSAPNDSGREPAVIFNDVQLKNVDLYYLSGKSGIRQHLNIASLDQNQLPNGMLRAELKGEFNARPVAFEGSVGPYPNLLIGQGISYSGHGNFGDLTINGDGFIDDLLQPRFPQFNLRMEGPNIDEITAMFGVDDLGSGGFSLLAKGEEVNGRYETGIDGNIGDISLGVTAYASDLAELHELDLEFIANGPSLAAVMDIFSVDHWPDKPFSIKGDVERVGRTLNISRLTLSMGGAEMVLDALLTNFPNFDASRVRLSIQGNDVEQFRELLGIGGIASGPFEVKGSLDVNPQEVELLQLEFHTSLGRMIISGTLGDAPDYRGSRLRVHLDGNNANTLMSIFDIDLMPDAAFSLDSQIESTDSGLNIERAVLVTEENERLELDGFISFEPGSQGTSVNVKMVGKHLQRLLGRLNTGIEVPVVPYEAGGQVRILEQGVRLDGVRAEFADIKLAVDGLIIPRNELVGTGLDIRVEGENFSSLSSIPFLSDAVGIFAPDQPYQVGGRFEIASNGWRLNDASGRLGETGIALNGLISNQPGFEETNFSFSINGQDLHAFLADAGDYGLPVGIFETSGKVSISGDSIIAEDLTFKTTNMRGNLGLELGLPFDSNADIVFAVNVQGEDIRPLLPPTTLFEPAKSAFKISTAGQRQNNLVSVKHLDAAIGNLQLSLKGQVDRDSSDESVDVTFTALSNDLSGLGLFNGEPLPPIRLDLNAHTYSNANRFSFDNISGKLGETDFSGNLEISLEKERPAINLMADSRLIDLGPFIGSAESEKQVSPTSKRDRVIPPTPLPLDALAAVDLALEINVQEVRLREDSITNLSFIVNIEEGKLTVPKLAFEGAQGKLVSSLSVVPTTSGSADVRIDAMAEGLIFDLLETGDENLLEIPPYDVELHITGNGTNLQELAASANGTLFMGSDGGKLQGISLGLLDTFILNEVFSLVMPKSKQDDVLNITCAATALKFTDGRVETDPAVAFTTDKITLISKGTLNLKSEKLHFNFNATPTNVLMISPSELVNPYILVTGTLAEPKVGLDPSKVLLHGGVAIGTAGISIVAKGLVDRIGTTKPLCEEMLENARQK